MFTNLIELLHFEVYVAVFGAFRNFGTYFVQNMSLSVLQFFMYDDFRVKPFLEYREVISQPWMDLKILQSLFPQKWREFSCCRTQPSVRLKLGCVSIVMYYFNLSTNLSPLAFSAVPLTSSCPTGEWASFFVLGISKAQYIPSLIVGSWAECYSWYWCFRLTHKTGLQKF